MRKNVRDSGTGRYVKKGEAEKRKLATVTEVVKTRLQAEKFLKLLRSNGGAIISSNDLSAEDIDIARREKRMLVDNDGFGYVFVPIEE